MSVAGEMIHTGFKLPGEKGRINHETLKKRVYESKMDMFHTLDWLHLKLDKLQDSIDQHPDDFQSQTARKMGAVAPSVSFQAWLDDYNLDGDEDVKSMMQPGARYEYTGETVDPETLSKDHSKPAREYKKGNYSSALLLFDVRNMWKVISKLSGSLVKAKSDYVRKCELAVLYEKQAIDAQKDLAAQESDWEILGLVEGSPIEDVKRQYRQMSMINHFDKSPEASCQSGKSRGKIQENTGCP